MNTTLQVNMAKQTFQFMIESPLLYGIFYIFLYILIIIYLSTFIILQLFGK